MIEAISRGCKGTLSDGTLRYVVDIAPKDRVAAAELFGEPGSPMVLARLTQEAAIQSAQAETIAAEKPKGGAMAKLAGQWCNDFKFWEWMETIGPEGVADKQTAAAWLYAICEIDSRAVLDHDPKAAEKFNRLIRLPYMAYLRQFDGMES